MMPMRKFVQPPAWIALCLAVSAFAVGISGCTPSDGSKSANSEIGAKDSTGKEAADKGKGDAGPGSSEEAKRTLEAALATYRKCKSYRDSGSWTIVAPGLPKVVEPFRVAFERPNHLALMVHNVQGTWSSTTWEAISFGTNHPYPKQRLVRPLPKTIDFAWIAGDNLGGLFVDPVGVPIQLELLLSDQSMNAVLDPGCKWEFLQRDAVDGQECDRVRMELKGLRWVWWIDRKNAVIRRVELPPQLVYPAATPAQLEGVQFTIDLTSAAMDQDIDWSQWRIPTRSEDVLVRRMVMPPPIASTQILGDTLSPFDLKDTQGNLLLDAAQPKRPISILCWIDESPTSEQVVRELMASQRSLVEEELSARAGIYLIASPEAVGIPETLKKWNCDLPLAIDQTNLSQSLFRISKLPSFVMLDRDRRVQVAETLFSPIPSSILVDLVRRLDAKVDLASRQLQQDADNQARFVSALHRVAINKEESAKLEPIREFQFALHGMRRDWRVEVENPLVSAGGAWFPEAAVEGVPGNIYPFSGKGTPNVMAVLDDVGTLSVVDDLGTIVPVGKIEIDQADGADRIHTMIDPQSQQWVCAVPEGLPRFWIAPAKRESRPPGSEVPAATTYNTKDVESPIAFAWASLGGSPALALATSESRMLVINPKTEQRFDALGDRAMSLVPGLDGNGHVAEWSALTETGRLTRISNLSSGTEAPMESRVDQLTFEPRPGSWFWGRHGNQPVTLSLANLPSGETGIIVCGVDHQAIRSRPITVRPEQTKLLSTVRLPDGTLYGLALGTNRILHLFTADLQIMDQVCFNAKILGASLYSSGSDLKLVVALDREISAWSIDVPGPQSAPAAGERIQPANP